MSTGNAVPKWTTIDNLLISVTAGGSILDRDWQEFMKELRSKPITKYLGGSLGKVEYSSTQRKEAADIMKSRGIKTAVITDDTLIRGMVTAVGWLGASVSAFSWGDMEKALKYLDVTGPTAEIARNTMSRLRVAAEMGR